MSRRNLAAALLAVACTLAAGLAGAQTTDAAIKSAANCAPASSASSVAGALHIVGGQNTEPRSIFGPRDLVVVGSGTAGGVQLGQQFFVRRSAGWNVRKADGPHAIITAGGLRIVSVNETTALATVDFACDAIMAGDYLEPYVEPVLPPGIARTDTTGNLDFSAPAHLLFGDRDQVTAGAGDFMIADVGSGRGAIPGARFAVYRNLESPGVPLQSVGEVVVMSAGADTSIVRVTLSSDAILTGDLLIPRK